MTSESLSITSSMICTSELSSDELLATEDQSKRLLMTEELLDNNESLEG